MALTPSQRETREWPLLVLAVAVVGVICIPLWQWISTLPPATDADTPAWVDNVQRAGRLLLGPEQVACYCFFTWGELILLSRYLEVRRQRRAFGLGLLPTEEGARILPADARPLMRKVEQTVRGKPYVLSNLIRLGLGKYAISTSHHDVSETLRTQAEVDQSRLITTMATVHYLAWAIPAIGFLGTVRGLAMSMTMSGHMTDKDFLNQVSQHLNMAFDCTLVALALSLPLMFLIHTVQRDEEALVIDCQQYCLEHLVNRLYEPQKPQADGTMPLPRAVPAARAAR
jgi:biopolymer transport protein ExbB/TolQ